VTDRIQTYALFIDPPLGRCGMTEFEIRMSGRRTLAAKFPMSRVSRAIEKGEAHGFAVDAESRQFLGAAILGTGGYEIIHVILDAMYAKAPYSVIQHAMHIHPTVPEFLPTVLGQLKAASANAGSISVTRVSSSMADSASLRTQCESHCSSPASVQSACFVLIRGVPRRPIVRQRGRSRGGATHRGVFHSLLWDDRLCCVADTASTISRAGSSTPLISTAALFRVPSGRAPTPQRIIWT
jgi:hypothetical protein